MKNKILLIIITILLTFNHFYLIIPKSISINKKINIESNLINEIDFVQNYDYVIEKFPSLIV